MKQKLKIVIAFLITFMVLAGCNISNDAKFDSITIDGSNSRASGTISTSQTGIDDADGMYFSFWSNSSGSSMSLNGGYNYTTSLSSSGNVVCGKGWEQGTLDREITYDASAFAGGDGAACLADYGWMTCDYDPLEDPTNTSPEEMDAEDYSVVEYYIVENHGGWTPPGDGMGYNVHIGNVQINGVTYSLHLTERITQGWILGDYPGSFYQFWAVRNDTSMSGTVDMQLFFNAWADVGFKVVDPSPYCQLMATEAFGTSVSSDVTLILDTPTNVTLSYDDNDATGGSTPSNSTYTAGSIATVSGNTDGLVRTGFTFTGWNTQANGSGTHYNGSATFTINSGIILYADWDEGTNPGSFRVGYSPGADIGIPPIDYTFYITLVILSMFQTARDLSGGPDIISHTGTHRPMAMGQVMLQVLLLPSLRSMKICPCMHNGHKRVLPE